jgi:hypothetical protein
VETLAERFERAQLFFDAGDFITASRLLAELVMEVPDEVATRLLLRVLTTTPRSWGGPRPSCARCSGRIRPRRMRSCCSGGRCNARVSGRKLHLTCAWPPP